jgi:CBS domain containing-hemolysin-like protein
MVDELYVMMTAVVIAVIAMLVAAKPLTDFITKRPSLVILCLGFLLMIGLVLMADGLGVHVPKGYVYAAIGFSVLIEVLNQLAVRGQRKWAESLPPRRRLIHSVLRTLGGVPAAEDPAKNLLAPQEKRMVRGVLELAERPVTAIMTPRTEVAWLDLHEEEMPAKLLANPHREFPVGRGSLDHVIGVVRKEDVLARYLKDGNPELEPLVREPLAVPERASVLQALDFFKSQPVELALVVDEYGTLRGVVTRTDLLEAIAGNLPDPAEQTYVQKRADGSLVIDGATPAYELVECFGELPPGEFNTAAGMVLAQLGRLPLAGERLNWKDWELEVAEVSDRRVVRLVAKKNRGPTPIS